MRKFTCERRADAEAIAEALGRLYPAHRFEVARRAGQSRYRIAIYCRASGSFLTYWES